jgi:hypothetical protein
LSLTASIMLTSSSGQYVDFVRKPLRVGLHVLRLSNHTRATTLSRALPRGVRELAAARSGMVADYFLQNFATFLGNYGVVPKRRWKRRVNETVDGMMFGANGGCGRFTSRASSKYAARGDAGREQLGVVCELKQENW